MRRILRALAALVAVLLVFSWPLLCPRVPEAPMPETLRVTFLDVGQGDAIVVRCGGQTMLVDGGGLEASQKIYSYLRNTLGLTHVDILVATHPHADHIGGLSAALNAVSAEVILTPVTEWEGASFADLKRYAHTQGAPMTVPSVGDVFALGGAEVTVLHCWPEAWDVNDMSIMLRVDYGSTSFLLTGDAEYLAEYRAMDSGLSLQADVLKVGHHGSNSSSHGAFLRAVHPTWAVISCGTGNTYGHPHTETLIALNGLGTAILRTDLEGDITFISDGETLAVETARSVDPQRLLEAPATQPPVRGLPMDAEPDETGTPAEVPATWPPEASAAPIVLVPEAATTFAEAPSPTPAAEEDTPAYIGNKSKKRFHLPDCPSVTQMSEKNKVFFSDRAEAVDAGYTPCGRCNP